MLSYKTKDGKVTELEAQGSFAELFERHNFSGPCHLRHACEEQRRIGESISSSFCTAGGRP